MERVAGRPENDNLLFGFLLGGFVGLPLTLVMQGVLDRLRRISVPLLARTPYPTKKELGEL